MKAIFGITAALLLCCACTETALEPLEGGTMVSVEIGRAATKALTEKDEDGIKDITVYIFDSNGSLNAEGHSSGSSHAVVLTARAAAGQTVTAFVNGGGAFDGFRTLAQAEAAVSFLSMENSSTVMAGMTKDVDLRAVKTVTVEVSRIAAKVQLCGITNRIEGKRLEIDAVYLVNVPLSALCFGSDSAWPDGLEWGNRMQEEGTCRELLYESVAGVSLGYGRSHLETHTFYTYPNHTTTDTHDGTWSPRCTRMVVEAQLDGEKCYYSMTMPSVAANTAYLIRELVITRKGSDTPDGDGLEAGYSIATAPWSGYADYDEVI